MSGGRKVIKRFHQASACAAICIGLAGCSTQQLRTTHLEVTSTISDLYTQQALLNLGRTVGDPWYIPSQTSLVTGQVQTSNSLTPTVAVPVARQLTDGLSIAANGDRTLSSGTLRTPSTLSMAASQLWQQNWATSPIVNAQKLTHLRALYRRLLFAGPIPPEHADYLSRVYPNGPVGWLYWRGSSAAASNLPETDESLRSLGRYGSVELLVKEADYRRGFVSNFVLATMADYIEPIPATLALPNASAIRRPAPTATPPRRERADRPKSRTQDNGSPTRTQPQSIRPSGGGAIDPGNDDNVLRKLQTIQPLIPIPSQ